MNDLETRKQYFAITGKTFTEELRISFDQYLKTIIAFYSALLSAVFVFLLDKDNVDFIKLNGVNGFIIGISFLALLNLLLSILALGFRFFSVQNALSELSRYVLSKDFDGNQPQIFGVSGKLSWFYNFYPKFFIRFSITSLIIQSILTFLMGLEILA